MVPSIDITSSRNRSGEQEEPRSGTKRLTPGARHLFSTSTRLEHWSTWLLAAKRLTVGRCARGQAHRAEGISRHAERLRDVVSTSDHLVRQRAVGVRAYFRDENRTRGLAVLVERDLAQRGLQLQ